MKTVAIVLAAIIGMASARDYCKEDDDCASKGTGITCVKSLCETYGMCGCNEHGTVMRFMGSERKFECVKIAKIGDPCDPAYGDGFCGAANSECRDGYCKCRITNTGTDPFTTSLEVRWGGEACLTKKGDFYAGEPCYVDTDCIASLSCLNSFQMPRPTWGFYQPNALYDGHLSALPTSPLDYNIRQCGCREGTRLVLQRKFHVAPMMGRELPNCINNGVGDMCFRDEDCSNIRVMNVEPTGSATGGPDHRGFRGTDNNDDKAGVCINRKCACGNNAYTHDITRMFCAPALGASAACAYKGSTFVSAGITIPGVCDGSIGLTCGNVCDIDPSYSTQRNYTCVCDQGWDGRGGSSCKRVTEGSTCKAHAHCASMEVENPICKEGACTAGAQSLVFSVMALALPLLAVLINQN